MNEHPTGSLPAADLRGEESLRLPPLRPGTDDVPMRPRRASGPEVVALGGGHGLSASLSALRLLTSRLTAVVTVADDGGSSGRLRQEFDVLPPGDLRMALSALCDDSDWGLTWRDVMQHRFGASPAQSTPLEGHALGNLLIVTLWELLGDPVAGLAWAGALLRAQGKVLPMSLTPLVIEGDVPADPEAGVPGSAATARTVSGQVQLSQQRSVSNVRLSPAHAQACPEAVTAVASADAVILGPGSWYTSVLPHVLLPQMREALAASPARKIITMNLARDSETADSSSADQLRILREYAPDVRFDTVIADPEAVESVEDVRRAAAQMGAQVHLAGLSSAPGSGTHSPFKLAAAYQEVMGAEAPRAGS